MTGKLKDLRMNHDGTQSLTVTIGFDYREEFERLRDKDINIEIKKASKHRSMDANAYLWHLCGEIAKATSKFSTDGKNEIYREAIKAKGVYARISVPVEGVEYFIKHWEERGTGWFAEVIDDDIGSYSQYDDFMGDPVEKNKIIHAYFGSSSYDTAEMSRIIDFVVLTANDLGVPTLTDKEEEKILSAWGEKIKR